jgi:hypothetical protein
MNLVTVLIIVFLGWLVYLHMQMYNNIEKELREIRVKCILPKSDDVRERTPNEKPFMTVKNSLITGLSSLY